MSSFVALLVPSAATLPTTFAASAMKCIFLRISASRVRRGQQTPTWMAAMALPPHQLMPLLPAEPERDV